MPSKNKNFIVTIDGPAAAGKTTVAKMLSKKFNWLYVNTGLLYRYVTYEAITTKKNLSDTRAVRAMKSKLATNYFVKDNELVLTYSGEDITDILHSPVVTEHVPMVAKSKVVRDRLLPIQKDLAREGNCIFEGRDIGTVVFPDANIKFYLDATIDERAERRLYQWRENGNNRIGIRKIKKDMLERDTIDSTRKVSPLKIPKGSIVLDTTWLTIDGVVDCLYKVITEKLET